MPATVRLKDIVDALEMQFDVSAAFLDLDTDQVETVSHALLREAEDSGDEERIFLHGKTRMGDCQANRFYQPLSSPTVPESRATWKSRSACKCHVFGMFTTSCLRLAAFGTAGACDAE
jgi:hypothetical protein